MDQSQDKDDGVKSAKPTVPNSSPSVKLKEERHMSSFFFHLRCLLRD